LINLTWLTAQPFIRAYAHASIRLILSLLKRKDRSGFAKNVYTDNKEYMRHECFKTEFGQRFGCMDSALDEEKLMFTVWDPKTDKNKAGIDNFVCTVDFCPFCGHSRIKKDKEAL